MAAVKVMVSSPILATNEEVPLVVDVCPSAIRTWVSCPWGGVPNLCAMFGLAYDFCACESRRAVTKPDLNSSSTAGVGILSGHVRFPLLDVGCVV